MQDANKKEYDLLIQAKILDKIKFCKSKNKIVNTDFLDLYQRGIAEKIIKQEKITNYIFYGGRNENADRNVLIFYPEKLNLDLIKNNIKDILEIVRIILPNDLKGKYEHRDYLSGIMKLGIKREKFGDIIVNSDGADIIVLKEIAEYIKINLEQLIRFKKAKIAIENIDELLNKETEFEEFKIIISSNRLDNFISELAKCSRTKATEIIEEGRVFINSENEIRLSKKINEKDIITIRGKGKFVFDSIEKETKSGKVVVNIKKYI